MCDPSQPLEPPESYALPPLSSIVENTHLFKGMIAGLSLMLAAPITTALVLGGGEGRMSRLASVFFSAVMVADSAHRESLGTAVFVSLAVSVCSLLLQLLPTSAKMRVIVRRLLLGPLLLSAFIAPSMYPAFPKRAFNPNDFKFESYKTGEKICENGDLEGALYAHPDSYDVKARWEATGTTTYGDGGTIGEIIGLTGDTRTALPFLLSEASAPEGGWTRRWVPVEDGEHVAVDCAGLEASNNHSPTFFLILHGLNGGSDEEYVKDFTNTALEKGDVSCVLIARGLMGTPVVNGKMFHGARIGDVDIVAKKMRDAMPSDSKLVGVGYSMGAITLANYVARAADKCALDAAIGIGGGLDMRFQAYYHRSQWLWQPLLARTLIDNFYERFLPLYKKKLSQEQLEGSRVARDVTEIDSHMIAPFNDFQDLEHYYTDMSAASDFVDSTQPGRIASISIPTAIVNALDDPIVCEKTLRYPPDLVSTNENLFILLTKKGGHVGYPIEDIVSTKWAWMTNVVYGFVEALGIGEETSVASEASEASLK